jgi:hypothetical protein
MKKILSLVAVALLVFTSCDINENPIEITTTTAINEVVPVTVPQTNGTAVDFEDTTTVNLADVISNVGDLTSVDVNSMSYKIKNFTGNTAGTVSLTLKVNGTVYASETDVNVSNAASAGTVFSVTDATLINQLESILLNDSQVNFVFSGSSLSDDGDMNFDIEISVNLTATIN